MALKRKIYTAEEAQLKMETLCSRSEQAASDIKLKLFRMGMSGEIINNIIESLKENRFIDETRYARSFANDKLRFSGWGPNKIKGALFLKKIPTQIIMEVIGALDPEIVEASLMKAAFSKAKGLDLTCEGREGYNNRKRLYIYLIGRGFSSSDANRAVKKMKENQISNA